MQSKLLGYGIPLAAATVFAYSWVTAHPSTLASQVAAKAARQGQALVRQETGRVTQAARRYLRARPSSEPVRSVRLAAEAAGPLTAPMRVRATGWGTTFLQLRWAPVPGAVGYRVKAVPWESSSYGFTAGASSTPVVRFATGSPFVLQGLQPAVQYAVTVQAERNGHWGPATTIYPETWMTAQQVYNRYADSIITLYMKRASNGEVMQGTGWALAGWTDRFVTCFHVVNEDFRGPDLWASVHNFEPGVPLHGQTEWAAEVGSDSRHDLAEVTVNNFWTLYLQEQQVVPSTPPLGLPLNTHKLWVGEPIAILGHPNGESLVLHTGKLTALGVKNWVVSNYGTIPYAMVGSAYEHPGASGSPVINPWGQVVGVDESGPTHWAHWEGIVPITALRDVTDGYLPPDYPPSFLGGLF